MSARTAGKSDPKPLDDAQPAATPLTMNKACRAFAVDLSAYFDGELEGADAERVADHLQVCNACQDTLRRLRKLRNALHSLSKPPRRGRSILADLKSRMDAEDDGTREESLPC